jgi:hypothetical protein
MVRAIAAWILRQILLVIVGTEAGIAQKTSGYGTAGIRPVDFR